MTRPLLRVGLLLTALLTAAVLLIHSQRYDSSSLTEFFAGCTPMPCWQGIHPGVTSAAEATAILEAHPWVEDLAELTSTTSQDGSQIVVLHWTWSKRYPFHYPFDEPTPFSTEGTIIFSDGIVQQIFVTSGLLLGDVWLTYGTPSSGTVDYTYQSNHLRVDVTALFDTVGLFATARVINDCSIANVDYWRTPVYFWVQPRTGLVYDFVNFPLYMKAMRTGYPQIRAAVC